MRLPTASSLERALACPISETLPRVSFSTPVMSRGTALHEHMRRIGGGVPLSESLAQVPEEWREDAERIDLDAYPISPDATYEVTVAWDYVTGEGRILGVDLGRDYSGARPTEYVGTADLVIAVGGPALVADYKSARQGKTHPSRNAQLAMLALAVRSIAQVETVDVALYYLDGTRPDTATLDALDLDLFAASLQELAERYGRGDLGEANPGGWCHYCPAKGACPAQRQALALVESGTLVEPLTVERVAAAWHRIRAIEGALEEAKRVCQDYASTYPVDLGDGTELREVEEARDSIDGEAAWPVLVGVLGEDGARLACPVSTTKSAIAKAAKATAPKGQAATAERAALAALRESGAITTTMRTTVKAVRQKKAS